MFKEALKITNNNIILTIPLVVFIYVLDLYSMFSRSSVDSVPKLVFASLTVLFMFGIFCAGWFHMVRKAVDLSKKEFVLDTDRAKASLNLLKNIPEGVSEYFLSFCGVYLIFFVLQAIATPIIYYVGVHLIGGLDEASMQNLQSMALGSTVSDSLAMTSFVDKLTPDQILFFFHWSLLFMVVNSIIMFLLMLWIPEIIYKERNPLFALFCSLKHTFKKFFSTLKLFLALWVVGFCLLFLNTFALIHPISYLLMSVVLFYFTVFFIVVIFLYFDKTYNVDADEA